MDKLPLVSIICTTYNHEAFVEDALKGFLMQITSFPFEIIVHDDASNDLTQEIIKRYSSKYPNVIIPILQIENQYSKKDINIWTDITFPIAKGKYIAICEGDDYWTDPYKLQFQIDALENNPECNMSIHSAITKSKSFEKLKWNYSDDIKFFYLEDVLREPGQFAATASYVFKKDVITKLPEWFKTAPVGDFFLEVYGALDSKILFIPRCMSVYRINNAASWSGMNLLKLTNRSVLEFYQIMFKYLLLLKNDLPVIHRNFFKPRLASCIYGQSLYYLANKEYTIFRKKICESNRLHKKVLSFQYILFLFRHFGPLARFLYISKLKYYNKLN